MLVRITTDPAARPNTLGALGMESDSDPKVSLNEFTYKKELKSTAKRSPPITSTKS
jgi:CRP/FNR family nitrogen fixation transcriptional regulator